MVGLDNGGTANNATVLDSAGRFLVDRMSESPSYVKGRPGKAIEALAHSFDQVPNLTGAPRAGRAVGLARQARSARTASCPPRRHQLREPAMRGFDVRLALETRLGFPSCTATRERGGAVCPPRAFRPDAAALHSSVSVIVALASAVA